jgi:serine/threonine protein kinase
VPSDEHRERAAPVGPDASDPALTATLAPAEAGVQAIGRYYLIQKIGEGGMGEVWLAEQREPVRRRVALKLVKAGMNSREVIARFESERQALALMNHSAISRVLDAGTTSQGAPYFVMEYVAGVPITEYCGNHRLTTRERLELFIPVCEGVQHAHHKAIIHRDLKPSNILVQEVDGRAMPKIIDFGVAKALTRDLSDGGILTRVGTLIGTPEYMSPEQATSSGEDIDTRSDVYSLGIVFYELLVGSPPLDFKRTAMHEFVRRLREEEPPKPSTRVQKQSRQASTAQAQKHRTEPLTLEKQLRGDLDAIALKALEKERSRRYDSPADFAADIRRYLNNEVVLAVPPSVGYHARKLARRYRVALATAAAFILVLIAASVVSIRQSLRANREAATAKAINNFLQDDMLAQADSFRQQSLGGKPDPDLKVRTALDRAAARIRGKFDSQPEVEASIRHTIGMTYSNLGIYAEARTQFQRSLDLYRKIEGPEGEDTLDLMGHLGGVLAQQGNYAEAQTLLSECLQEARRKLGPEHEITLNASLLLGLIKIDTGQYQDAEPLIQRVAEVDRRMRGPEDRATLFDTVMLGRIRFEESKKSEAEAILSPLADVARRRFGPADTLTLRVLNLLGQLYSGEGKFEQAEAIMKEAVEGQRQALGPEHPATLAASTGLANVYAD